MSKRRYNYFVLLYPFEDLTHQSAFDYIKTNYQCAYITHDMDTDDNGEIKKSHVHVVVHLTNACTLSAFAKRLNIAENYIKYIDSIDNALIYLIHKKDPDKYQYEPALVQGSLRNQFLEAIANTDTSESDFLQLSARFIYSYKGYLNLGTFIMYLASEGLLPYLKKYQLFISNMIKEHNSLILKK